eukprot:gene23318-biopygen4315
MCGGFCHTGCGVCWSSQPSRSGRACRPSRPGRSPMWCCVELHRVSQRGTEFYRVLLSVIEFPGVWRSSTECGGVSRSVMGFPGSFMECSSVPRSGMELDRYGLSLTEYVGGRGLYGSQVCMLPGGTCPRSSGTSQRGTAATSASRCRENDSWCMLGAQGAGLIGWRAGGRRQRQRAAAAAAAGGGGGGGGGGGSDCQQHQKTWGNVSNHEKTLSLAPQAPKQ